MNDARAMLAYTIWHWPRQGVERDLYEAHNRRFHAVLARDPAPGFKASQSTRVTGLSWANDGKQVYQDRFLVNSWSVFDELEPHAISGTRQEPHRHVATTVGGAIAGMYGLRLGTFQKAPRWSYWFSKPDGMTYEDLDAAFRPVLKRSAVLWGRKLVLGATPEFCVESEAPIELPGVGQPLVVRLEPVWNTFDEYDRQRSIESHIII